MTIENETVVVLVPIGIVAVDFHDFGDKAPPRTTFEIHDDIDGITYVGFDGAIGQVHTALQNAARKPRKALFRGSGVDRRKASRVSRVEKLQEIERLAATDFAQD